MILFRKEAATRIPKGLGRIAGGFNHRRHCAHTMSPERTTLILFFKRRVRSNPAELDFVQYPLEGYKYLGCRCSFAISNTFPVFL